MAETTHARAKPTRNRKFLLVRYGHMKHLALFNHNETHIPHTPARVVVKTDKGLELGHLVGQLSAYKDGRFRFSEEQISSFFVNSEINFNSEPAGRVIRFATPEDISEEQHLEVIAKEEIACCEQFAKELGLEMKIIDAEHIFGGERVIFYFMAEGRVDFRELVRKLAHEYQTRIEMRQIGSRDEAKLLGDIESCGRECCCKQFLQLLKPVNMRMAKMQKATLDPSKISGRCGRLMCCLRFEDKMYDELKRNTPKKGRRVRLKDGTEGEVVATDLLQQTVKIEVNGGPRSVVASVDDIEASLPKAPRPPRQNGRSDRPEGKQTDAENRRQKPSRNRRRAPTDSER